MSAVRTVGITNLKSIDKLKVVRFWAVGVLGEQVIWYNDIEDGFNTSRCKVYGTIDEYWCDQLELHHVIWNLRQQIETGATQGKCGPPEALGGSRRGR